MDPGMTLIPLPLIIRIVSGKTPSKEFSMHQPICRTVMAIVVFAIVSLLAPPARLATQDQSPEIVLAEGTPIKVVTTQEISSKDAKPNDPVNFTVNEDLVVN